MDKIQILKNLQVLLNKNFIEKDIFNKCKTIKGKTQKAEENYMDVIKSSLDELNLKYIQASRFAAEVLTYLCGSYVP